MMINYNLKKLTIIFLCSVFTIALQAQQIPLKQTLGMGSLGINTHQLDIQNSSYQFLLPKSNNRRRRTNKAFGYIFSSIGLLTATGGILMITNNNQNNSNDDIYGSQSAMPNLVGGFAIVMAAAEIGISIPFFVAAKRN